jgi:antitoxin MazE
MTQAITARVVRVGNSHGIRIPKPILEQLGIEDEVELVVEDGELRVRPKRRARAGWTEQFAAMHANGDDRMLWEDVSLTVFDEQGWEW